MIFYGVKKMKNKNRGFTIIELLIVVAIISILASIGIPVFSNSLEKSRESVDIANVRAAYAEVMTAANLGEPETAVKIVPLNQKKDGWQSMDPINIGGIIHYKNQGDTDNWKGNPVAGGICEVSYNESCGAVFTWSSKTDSSVPEYPFNTGITAEKFFSLLYDTEFWKNGSLNNTPNFEFDSRCPDSEYIPAIEDQIKKLNNSLLQRPESTWAYLGSGNENEAANRYLFWTSLNTNKIGAGKQIPVLIQTGDGRYYVSETTTGERTTNKGKHYVAVSDHLHNSYQYKNVLNKGSKYNSLTDAYDAYLKALADTKYKYNQRR